MFFDLSRCPVCRSHVHDARSERAVERKWREKARSALNVEVRAGRVGRPVGCERCGGTKKVQAHHEDYSRPLHVIWLCAKCHKQEHAKEAQKPRRFPVRLSPCSGIPFPYGIDPEPVPNCTAAGECK